MSPKPLNERSVLIVGGGTFGTSTAYHLTQRGYKSIKVLDRWAPPSKEAAGNDINKVIRADYSEPLYAKLASEAMKIWKDPSGLFNGLFHPSGWIIGAGKASLPFVEESIKNSEKLGLEKGEWLTAEETRKRWPAVTGDMNGWKILWNGAAGWANAREAMTIMANVAMKAGAEYIYGDSGYVKQLIFDEKATCIGVRCADGSAYFADLVILAAGASAGGLLDLKGQLIAKGHTVGHIQLSPEEVKKYKNIPIVDHLEDGIMFPPNEDGVVKFGAVRFCTNFNSSVPGVSLPRYRSDNPNDDIPKIFKGQLREFTRAFSPELADREWFDTRICWDADTADLHFLIGQHPSHPQLNLAIGGSAHGFKFLPIVGSYIVDMLEDKLDPEIAKKWKWRPGATRDSGAANPHPNATLDLEDIPGWGKNDSTFFRGAKL